MMWLLEENSSCLPAINVDVIPLSRIIFAMIEIAKTYGRC